jgi:hypothetical protein
MNYEFEFPTFFIRVDYIELTNGYSVQLNINSEICKYMLSVKYSI